jgi:hypothetical protein
MLELTDGVGADIAIDVAGGTASTDMNPFLDLHKTRPVIDHVYGFGDAVEAFEHLARGLHSTVWSRSLTFKCCIRSLA